MPEKNKLLKTIGLRLKQIFIITSITLVLLEISLGIFFYFKDSKLIETETTDYPYFYFKLLPESGIRNSDGFKTSYERKKPDGITRIAVTGGSVAYGSKSDESIAANLEKNLKQEYPNRNFQVINAGVPAFVVEQEFIMIQLVLQYYNPDIIVSVSGYNDLLSCDINRYYSCSDPIPPHNWRDFKSIQYNRKKNSLSSRFFALFTNINRLADFIYRKTSNEQKLYDELLAKKQIVASTYAHRVNDIHDFCTSKNILYFHFVQPVNWPLNDSVNPVRNSCLKLLYSEMKIKLDTCNYVTDLTAIFDTTTGIYTDECHVISAGNQIIASEIQRKISKSLQ